MVNLTYQTINSTIYQFDNETLDKIIFNQYFLFRSGSEQGAVGRGGGPHEAEEAVLLL